jgi:hypothetical protein
VTGLGTLLPFWNLVLDGRFRQKPTFPARHRNGVIWSNLVDRSHKEQRLVAERCVEADR